MLHLRIVTQSPGLVCQKFFSRASSDTCLKWLLGPDQDLVFTFSNPALQSALLVEFGHKCPVMFDPAGFPGTIGQPVSCRVATRGKTPLRAVLSEFCKVE